MSHDTYKLLWQSLDVDLSGELTWDELSQHVFSRDDEELNSNIVNLWRVRNQLAQVLVDSGTHFCEWRKYLDTLCRHMAKVNGLLPSFSCTLSL